MPNASRQTCVCEVPVIVGESLFVKDQGQQLYALVLGAGRFSYERILRS